MKVQHHFLSTSHDIEGLFKNTNKLSTFMNKIEKQSIIDPDRYSTNDYLGDGFEFLMEIFIKSREYDERIGISEYSVVKSNKDNGVDGYGYNINGDKCVIQHKYRANNTSLLTANEDHLSNMVSDGIFQHGVKFDKDNLSKVPLFYVFTTAKGLHYYTDNEMFKGHVKCYGYDDLRRMLDNNINFWNLCRKIVKK